MKSFLREILITVVLAVVMFFALQAAIDSVVIPSPSMVPTLQIGQRLIVSKVTYFFHEPQRGDIVTFHPPTQPKDAIPLIKRIIGLPGESVEIRNGIVYIHTPDGKILQLDEPYVNEPANSAFVGDVIPENEYLVLGDNRNNSDDSRRGWTLPEENIIGKAWLTIWPPSQWGLFHHPNYDKEPGG